KEKGKPKKVEKKSGMGGAKSGDGDGDGGGSPSPAGKEEAAPAAAAAAAAGAAAPDDLMAQMEAAEAERFKLEVQGRKAVAADGESSDDEIGPKPAPQASGAAGGGGSRGADYGGALRPGEGAAIAQFVQKNMRIPRRGEVGWQGNEIERLENLGYVMSGSRHARMNAIRIRKENQVYTAEEKRALALITAQEQQEKETKILGDFRAMLSEVRAGQRP
ncbi:unnamed protein product, partial [Phaeothamnion confervicola]